MDTSGLFDLSPGKIAAVYLVFGVTWIATTDALVVVLFDSPETITLVQSVKGWVFVALSGLLLYGLSSAYRRQVERSQTRLQTASEQLQVLHRIFRHNIRNELNVVLANLELADDRIRDEQTRTFLETARQTALEIVATSEKLKAIDSLELNGSKRRVDLTSLTADSVETVSEIYPGVEISIDSPDAAPVYGDYTLHRVIVELVENAVEHNPNPPESCEVSVEVRRRNGEVELAIRDNGPSIPDHEVEAIRAGVESDLVHTSGVGLWIAKWVSEHHGGTLEIDSEPEDGTTIVLRFDRHDSRPVVERLPARIGGRTATA